MLDPAPEGPIIQSPVARVSPALRALRKASPETYTVIIQDPRTGADSADLIAVPAHDKLSGENVMHTLTAPHKFSPDRRAALRRKIPKDIADLPSPRIKRVFLNTQICFYIISRMTPHQH